MIRLLIKFAVVVGLAGLFAWVAERPGVVRIDWLDRRIEAPLAMTVIILFIGFAICLWLISLLRRTLRAPGTMSDAYRARRMRKGLESLSRGMVAIGAGDLQTARRHASIAARYLDKEPLARLLEVQTAQASGDSKRISSLFEAMTKTAETRLLGLRGLFNQARQSGDLARAGSIAGEALKIHPGLPWASNAMLMIQSADKNWRGAAETLDSQRRSGVIDEATANRKRAVLLTAQANEQESATPQEALQLALKAQKLDPTLVPAAVTAGRLLAAHGQTRKATRVVERTYALHPHVELVRIYAFLKHGAAPRERLKRTELLVSRFGGGEEGAVGVAEAAIAALDWEKAKRMLMPFMEGRPRARVCALMAEIAEGEGDKGLSREWLARGMRASADPKWTADGIISEQWRPVSPVTGELGAFQWKVPVERLTYEEADSPEALPQVVAASQTQATELAAVEESPVEAAAEAPQAAPASPDTTEEPASMVADTRQNESAGLVVKPPLPDDPGPEREEDSALTGKPDDWARRLVGSS
jgi:HemY protein